MKINTFETISMIGNVNEIAKNLRKEMLRCHKFQIVNLCLKMKATLLKPFP